MLLARQYTIEKSQLGITIDEHGHTSIYPLPTSQL